MKPPGPDAWQIDWNQVAADNGVTNGHAARMRFSRFKQQMEGTYPTRRTPKDASDSAGTKKGKTPGERRAKKLDKRRKSGTKNDREDGEDARVKEEDDDDEEEGGVKLEPMEDGSVGADSSMEGDHEFVIKAEKD